MTEIMETGRFMRKVRSLMRVGEYSRERLDILRVEVRRSEAECDWITRPPDVWDMDVAPQICERNFAQQALQDALRIREILLESFSAVRSAELRAYKTEQAIPELLMTGTVFRNDEEPARSISPAMRAKLLGFKFRLTDGALVGLASD